MGMDDVASVGRNALALVRLQLFSRILTFILNNILIRLTSPAVLGLVTIKLELLYNTILFMSREGLRLALLRYNRRGDDASWLLRLVHMSWLALPSSIPLIVFFSLFYHYKLPREIVESGTIRIFWSSILAYMVSSVIELLVEPCYLLAVHQQRMEKRIGAEVMATTVKAFSTLSFCLFLKQFVPLDDISLGLLSYTFGQLAYSLTLLIKLSPLLGENKILSLRTLIPRGQLCVEPVVIQTAQDMSTQVYLKYFLGQGDMWIISMFAPLKDQGIYALATNYGSLLCRICLQPIEESILNFVSSSISEEALQGEASDATVVTEKRRMALDYLSIIIKLYGIFASFLVFQGRSFAHLFVRVVLGPAWMATNLPHTLSCFCLLLPIMAFSGILEAFNNATMNKEWQRYFRISSILTSIIYSSLAIALTRRAGSIGLILANMANFSMRSCISIFYLYAYCQRNKTKIEFRRLLPHPVILLAGILSSLLVAPLTDILGILCIAALNLTAILISERTFFMYIMRLRSKID